MNQRMVSLSFMAFRKKAELACEANQCWLHHLQITSLSWVNSSKRISVQTLLKPIRFQNQYRSVTTLYYLHVVVEDAKGLFKVHQFTLKFT